MSSLPNIDQLASRAASRNRLDFNSNTPPSSFHGHSTTSGFRISSNQNYALTWSATRSTSHQPSESSETTMLGGFYDDDMFDNASSVTLQNEFPWHGVDLNKYPQKIPYTIVPALLQGVSDLSPSSRSSLDGAEGGSREVDEDSSYSRDTVPRYSTAQKGKCKARMDDVVIQNSRQIKSPSPQFHYGVYNPVEEWVIHHRPILQDYANRQTSLPLGRRLEVSIDEPSEFILGAIQLLVNRDRRGCADRSRQLGPQLIENYVDINRWATEYFRSRHGTHVVDSDVPTLLTIVMNNFYEGQVQLIDRLVEFALENMRFGGRSSLGVKDFAFGFDFKMSQDLPFYVETSSQIREPPPIRTVEVQSTSQPVTTNSGRQVKPTKRAQAASEQAQTNASGRHNKGKNTSRVKDKRAANGSAPAARQKKNPPQPSSGRTVQKAPLPSQAKSHVAAHAQPKTTAEHTKHRLTRSSNPGLPPILPASSSTPGKTPSRSDDSSKSKLSTSASADTPKASGSSGPNPTVHPPPRLKITLPVRSLPASTVPATSNSGLTLNNTNGSTSQQITQANTSETTNRGRGASRSGGAKPRGPRNGRGRGHERGNEPRTKTPTPEAAPDKTKVLPTAHPVAASNAVASAAVNLVVAPPVYALRSAVGTTSRSRPHGADNSIGTRNSRRLTSQNMRTEQPRLPPTDPGHPQGRKRKLDDSED